MLAISHSEIIEKQVICHVSVFQMRKYSPLSIVLVMDFYGLFLPTWRSLFIVSKLLKSLLWWWNYIKVFSTIFWDNHVSFLPCSVNLISCINGLKYWTGVALLRQTLLGRGLLSFATLLQSVCLYFAENFSTCLWGIFTVNFIFIIYISSFHKNRRLVISQRNGGDTSIFWKN